MAKRYSGDIELRIACRQAERALYYVCSMRAPGIRQRYVLPVKACGVMPWFAQRSESYDRAARHFIAVAHRTHGVGRFASFVGPRGKERLEILRVQQAPCPVR